MTKTIAKPKPDIERIVLTPGVPWRLDGQRVGDLVLDVLRRAAGPVGEDDDLLLADVGDGVDRRVDEA